MTVDLTESPDTTNQGASSWTVEQLLTEIRPVGRAEDGSYFRYALGHADLDIREWFIRKAGLLGLDVRIDGNANIWAWWGEPGPGAVLTGSHLDSVPGGGAFDGPLGVASALVALSQLRATGFTPARPMAVVVFTDEEGAQFGMPCLGSRLATGDLPPSEALDLTARDGTPLADFLRSCELDPDTMGPVSWLTEAASFVELHVEQGRGLAALDSAVAIGSAVRPHGRWRLEFSGQGNHAGTTLLAQRHDPVIPLAATITAARSAASDAADLAVATVGRLEVVPGGTNVIASSTRLWLDCRAENESTVTEIVQRVVSVAEDSAGQEGCGVSCVRESWTPRTVFDDKLREVITGVLGESTPQLSTGAGHDAAVLAGHLPSAMLFVRNPSGASHTPIESAQWPDCELGASALRGVLAVLVQ